MKSYSSRVTVFTFYEFSIQEPREKIGVKHLQFDVKIIAFLDFGQNREGRFSIFNTSSDIKFGAIRNIASQIQKLFANPDALHISSNRKNELSSQAKDVDFISIYLRPNPSCILFPFHDAMKEQEDVVTGFLVEDSDSKFKFLRDFKSFKLFSKLVKSRRTGGLKSAHCSKMMG